MRTLAALAALVVAAPALAQANGDAAPAPPAPERAAADVDPALVGEWRLLKVVEAGTIGRFGGEVEGMTCEFDADGSAEVYVAVMQDRELVEQEKAFRYATDDGAIVRAGAEPVRYEVISGDLLVLSDRAGLVVHLVRVD